MISDHCQNIGSRPRDRDFRPAKGAAATPERLTVLVPVFNEARTVMALLRRVAASPYSAQIIVIDDDSRDETVPLIERWLRDDSRCEATLLRRSENGGKGAAIRTGLPHARGEIVLIQDADLEYDPDDYPALIEPIRSGSADVVYGSRFPGSGARSGRAWHRLCRLLLNAAVWMLYGRRLTDEATCYKVFRTDLLRRLDLKCERFEFCPEVTSKLCRLGIAIHEVPISYRPRTTAEGKKIGWRDAVQAFWTLIWWRFAPVRLLSDEELDARASSQPSSLRAVTENRASAVEVANSGDLAEAVT